MSLGWPCQAGKEWRPVVLASSWSVCSLRHGGKGLWTGMLGEYVSRTLRVALARLCTDELAREMDIEVVGTCWDNEIFCDSISPLLVMEKTAASGSDPVFLAISMQFRLSPGVLRRDAHHSLLHPSSLA